MSGPSNRVLEIQGGLFADRTALIPGKIYIYRKSLYKNMYHGIYNKYGNFGSQRI
jgi:hypothetical protein